MVMLACVAYLAALIWAFGERRLGCVWTILGLGGPIAFAMARAVAAAGG